MHRRTFLQGTAAAGLSVAVAPGSQPSPNDRISVCVVGVRGRGGSLLNTFASLPDVNVPYVRDFESARQLDGCEPFCWLEGTMARSISGPSPTAHGESISRSGAQFFQET